MEEQLITLLDDCLEAVRSGESVESCLARHPDMADELAPYLQLVLALDRMPQLGSTTGRARMAKARFLAEAERRRPPAKRAFWSRILGGLPALRWPAPLRAFATAAVSLTLVLIIGSGLVSAASGSLPGDPLYGFKLLGEDVRRALAFSTSSRINLEEAFTARRQDEVGRLLQRKRQEEVMFAGLLRERDGNLLQIADITVIIDQQTRMQTEPLTNAFIRVRGITQVTGTVLAQWVETEGDVIIGRLEGINLNRWRVANHEIQLNDRTAIQDQTQIGDCVKVLARRFSDGTLLALEIGRTTGCTTDDQMGDNADQGTVTSTPTATPTENSTSTPSPTATHERTPTPTMRPSPTPISPPLNLVPTPADSTDNQSDDDDAVEQEEGNQEGEDGHDDGSDGEGEGDDSDAGDGDGDDDDSAGEGEDDDDRGSDDEQDDDEDSTGDGDDHSEDEGRDDDFKDGDDEGDGTDDGGKGDDGSD